MTQAFIATCARGLEPVLADELRSLGVLGVDPDAQAVHFEGSIEDAYRVCLWSRIASRVLLPLDTVYAKTVRAFYAELRRIRWTDHLRLDKTFAVHFVGTDETFRNSYFGGLKVKDAIVDSMRDHAGERPNVDTDDPDLRIHVHLSKHRATVSIDLSGEPLHLRGRNRDGGGAPLKENLAAGILRFAGWHDLAAAGAPLCDPMCGSGTLLVEAVDVLRDRAPGLGRKRWGFKGWAGHDDALWRGLVAEAKERVRPTGKVSVFGYDRDPQQIERALANLAKAGSADDVWIDKVDVKRFRPPDDRVGVVVTNPPYGERMGKGEVERTWSTLGNVLRRRFLGWDAWLVAGVPAAAKRLGLRPAQRIPLFNGPLEGRLLHVPIAATPVARDSDEPDDDPEDEDA